MDPVTTFLNAKAERTENALRAYLAEWVGAPSSLVEAVAYSLFAGGKRLRPALALGAAEIVCGEDEAALPAACALEMIHTYSLIHDDLPAMDDDDVRRGRPTCHKVYGEAMAILAGDALLTMAFEVLSQDSLNAGAEARRVAEAVATVARAAGAAGMVGGQVEDLYWEGRQASAAVLEDIHRLKTGALFRASLLVGGLLGGGDAGECAALDTYGRHLGLAFQIQDDVLDVIGDTDKLGKTVGKDWQQQKNTYVTHFGLDGARARAAAAVAAAVAALAPYGSRGEELCALARYTVLRDR